MGTQSSLKISLTQQQPKQSLTLNQQQIYKCYFCRIVLPRKSSLYSHLKIHTLENLQRCLKCKAIVDYINYKMHVKLCDKPNPFKCEFCGVCKGARNNLYDHIRRAHTRDIFNEKCYFCRLKVGRSCYMLRHLRIHTCEKPFSCKYCPNVFVDAEKLNRHIRSFQIQTDECTALKQLEQKGGYFCYKICNTWEALKYHMTQHTQERPYKCQNCGSPFHQNYQAWGHCRQIK